MSILINYVSNKGGSVTLNEKHGVSCSYAVAGIVGDEPAELLYTWINLPSGKQIQFFVNRETGIVVVDIVNKKQTGGKEVLRINVNEVEV